MLVGVSTHMPAVVDAIESKGWDLDYYMTCVYERHRSEEELEKLLGQVPLPVGEVYLKSDPPRMFKAIRQTKRTCLAFKILAAGRLSRAARMGRAGVPRDLRRDQARRRRDHRHLRPLQRPARGGCGACAAIRVIILSTRTARGGHRAAALTWEHTSCGSHATPRIMLPRGRALEEMYLPCVVNRLPEGEKP